MELFGTDGVRGEPNRFPLDLATVVCIGRAVGRKAAEAPGTGRVCLARDTRKSGPFLAAAVSAGILSEGGDVIDMGVLPTPACAALLSFYGARAGVVISASHNPAPDNGIKVFNAAGYKLTREEEDEIERFVAREREGASEPTALDVGEVLPAPRAFVDYLSFLGDTVPTLSLAGMTIVIDASNGAMSRPAPEILRQLGADVVTINDQPNGTNINDRSGSEHPERAALTVREKGAHIGLVFDGDGDRVILIDEQGNVVDGDRILAITALDRAERGKLPGGAIACTEYSNKGLDLALGPAGIAVVRRGVGDRDVLAAMREFGYAIGGEQSGHIIFSELATTGDGLLTALQVLELLTRRQTALSELASVMQALPQVLLAVEVPRRIPLAKLPKTTHTIAETERSLADRGRVYVRYSGTQNVLRIMVEGEDEAGIRKRAEAIATTAQQEIRESDPLPA